MFNDCLLVLDFWPGDGPYLRVLSGLELGLIPTCSTIVCLFWPGDGPYLHVLSGLELGRIPILVVLAWRPYTCMLFRKKRREMKKPNRFYSVIYTSFKHILNIAT